MQEQKLTEADEILIQRLYGMPIGIVYLPEVSYPKQPYKAQSALTKSTKRYIYKRKKILGGK